MEMDSDHGNKEELIIWAYSSRVRVHREEEACLGSQNGKPRNHVFTRKTEAERAVWKWGETIIAQSRPSVIFPEQPLPSRELAFKYPCLRAGSGGIAIQTTTVSEAV